MTAVFPAHDLVVTRLCKVASCVDDAVDAIGRFAGLCAAHKRAAIAQAQAEGSFAVPRPENYGGALAETGRELARQARKVERVTKQLDDERDELRKIYLRFGVAAGFLRGGS